MSEVTITLETWGHRELEAYLKSLSGVNDAHVDDDGLINIYVKYDSSLISSNILYYEIYTFLNVRRVPSMTKFDKFSVNKVEDYTVNLDSFCCEYCVMGAIEDLFFIEGVVKVDSNISDCAYAQNEVLEISVKYDPNLLTLSDMKRIFDDLNI